MISFLYNVLHWELKKSLVVGGVIDILFVVLLAWSVK
jgi:hypothetical protein